MKNISHVLHGLLLASLFICFAARGQVRITEFMASNTDTLADQDGDFSDWIEIQNTSGTSVNLYNWALTDSSGNLAKWLFPATNIAPGGFMVIFASGKDRRIPGQELHTNFKLSADGEYLALVRPDLTLATEFSPEFPRQFPDVSYGSENRIGTTTLVTSNAAIRFLIPANASVDGVWEQTNFDDSAWPAGVNGVGYETGIADPQEESFATKLLATQPVAYWRLNETTGPAAANLGSDGVSDEGGYQGGIVLGDAGPRSPQFSTFEATNNAPTFDGTSAWINGPYELVNDLPAFTISGWINPATAQSSRAGLFGQNDTMEFGFDTPSTIEIWTPAGSVTASYPFPNQEWHYVTAVGGDGQLALYLDGILAGRTAVSAANFGESEYNFNIGGGIFDPTGNYFTGQIDEVAVWYRALTTNEISSLLATNSGQVSYTNYLNTDVQTQMYGSNSSAYVRFPFSVADPSAFDTLALLVRYDDGFVAYLNGQQIASANAPASPAWNSAATQRHLDTQAVQWQEFDVSAAQAYLQAGNNVLAIQALNIAPTNTDFLMQAQLLTVTASNSENNVYRYFSAPTPGGPNGTGTNDLGPVLSGAGHTPNVPQATDSLTVTARVAQAFAPIANVTLHYRVMFNAEASVPMNDAGTNGDATANNGIWTGRIPAGVASAGQLIRYYVVATDSAGNVSRWPIFPDPLESQQYYGTVVDDPSLQSQLPVAGLFIQNPAAADNRTGTRASLFYLNELYDNLNIYVHGQSSANWPKKSHNLDFPKDHQFLYQPNGIREKKVIFMSNYGDKSRMHTTLTYAIAAQSGGAALFSFPIRIQLNGSFWGVEDLVEHGDDLWLDRIGRDGNGALYKMYNSLNSVSGNEKKTREWDSTYDLMLLIANLEEFLGLTNRVQYACDNLDLPQATSYFADMAIASSQDLGAKNYYLYRDSDGTGEWAIFPWDVDLTWGRNWIDGQGYFTDTLYTNNALNFYNAAQQNKVANRLFDLFFAASDFRQMYLRRLRTLMDTLLLPPGAPTNALVIEPLIRQCESRMNPPDITPSDTALDYTAWGPQWGNTSLSQFPGDAERIISTYLPGRRNFLYSSNAALNGDFIPAAQPTNTVVLIGSWDYSPASGNQNEQYLELHNTNSYAVDVSGWRLIGGIEITLRPGTVIPAGKSLYLAANVKAFRARVASPHSKQGLFVQGPFGGFLNTQGNTPLILENDQGAPVSRNSFAGNSSAAAFVAGNLAVLRVGDGVQTPGSRGNSVFIDQFNPAGTLVGSLPMPDNAANALIVSGSASSEGALTRSADGRLLEFAGYQIALTNAALLGSSLANANAINAPRALGIVDLAGTFALAGVTTNQYGGNNIRSGTTDGRGNYWGAGATSGTFYFGSGPTNSVQTNVVNTVVIQDLGGNLYFCTSKSTPGIWKIPGAPAVYTTPAVFLPTGAGSSPYAFALSPGLTTAYIADDTLTGKGGVQRWDYNGSAWSMSYAFAGITNVGARGLAVNFNGANPVIYATTAEAAANRLVAITDTGAASTATTLATAGVNQLFRGVCLAPDSGFLPQFFKAAAATNGFALSWTALLNRNYTVQYNNDLSTTNWLTLTNLTVPAPVMTVIDPRTATSSNRFYRVILNP